MSNLSTQPIKGFADLYPEDFAVQKWIFDKARKVSSLFGYQEYEGPIVETVELYEAKSSRELVREQTFQLTDRGGRKLALRPELTPTLARMIAQKQYQLPFPIRWFSIGPRFRYETPQKGRGRQFYQWDVDLLGVKTPEADAEIVAIAVEFLKNLGFNEDEVVVKVNNRRLMELKLSLIDIPKQKMTRIFSLIDKKDQMGEDNWIKLLEKEKLSYDQIKNLLHILKDKDFSFESDELTEMFSTLKDLGVDRLVEFDPTVVRGLDYYTGTVFEGRDKKGKLRAILGGGRYDDLVGIFGGRQISGVGFACGNMVIAELLKEYGKYPKGEELNIVPTKVLVTVFAEETFRPSLRLASLLYGNEVPAEIYPDSQVKLDKQLKYADRKGIPYAVLLGPDEIGENKVTLKDLRTGKQEKKTTQELIEYLNEEKLKTKYQKAKLF